MAVSDETRLVIEATSYRVAREVCELFKADQVKDMELHEARCPGRRVGRLALAIVAVAGAVIGGVVSAAFKKILGG